MSVTVNFPASLSHLAGPVGDRARIGVEYRPADPGARSTRAAAWHKELDDPLYNIAINEEILLHSVDSRPVKDGDIVEVIPTSRG
jgi:hypothetical protein